VEIVTGSGNSGLNLNDQDAEKKDFYGLLKKKQGMTSEEKPEAPEAVLSASAAMPHAAPELKALENVIGQTAHVQEPAADTASRPAHDFSTWAALAKKADNNAEAPQADEGNEPEELKKILSKTATFNQGEAAASRAPAVPDAFVSRQAPSVPASAPAPNFSDLWKR
jgi:hypothetical protein